MSNPWRSHPWEAEDAPARNHGLFFDRPIVEGVPLAPHGARDLPLSMLLMFAASSGLGKCRLVSSQVVCPPQSLNSSF